MKQTIAQIQTNLRKISSELEQEYITGGMTDDELTKILGEFKYIGRIMADIENNLCSYVLEKQAESIRKSTTPEHPGSAKPPLRSLDVCDASVLKNLEIAKECL